MQGVEQDAAPSPHWAYSPFRAVDPPTVSEASRVVNSIDRFVLARLEGEGLTLSPPADRRTLIRRLSLDLVGMSPTLDELETFLADDRADAYEWLVDRLLASQHYAERWARHWLDLARYADSNGYAIDGARSIWPYRDWVIQAIAEGMPFETSSRSNSWPATCWTIRRMPRSWRLAFTAIPRSTRKAVPRTRRIV